MVITGAAATLAGLLAARRHIITTTLGVLDVATTVVDRDNTSATLAMRWTTPRDETRGLVLRLDDEDVSMWLHNSLFGDSNYIYDLISSCIEAEIRKVASDLTTYLAPHLNVDAVFTAIEEMERSDLFQLPTWEQEVREHILAAQDDVEADLEARVEASGAWTMVDDHARKIARRLVDAHPGLVGE